MEEKTAVLVAGMGAYAYGKERRAVTALSRMERIRPHFFTSKWEDGSVERLLQQYDFEYSSAPFGYLGRARPKWTLVNVLHMPRLFGQVGYAFFEKDCDVILILDISAFVNALPVFLLLKILTDARLVFYLGDTPEENRIHRVLGRFMNRYSDAIIVNSKSVKRGLRTIGVNSEKVNVVYNGVEWERFDGAPAMPLRERFGWAEDAIVVGYAGQFAPNKGVKDVIEAARLLRDRGVNCRFVLIGECDEESRFQKELQSQIEASGLGDHVKFTGWVDRMERAYAAVDIMVVPSRYEDPAPNVNLEAMASGTPVVATRAGGSPELIAEGETGVLVDKRSPEQIARHVERLAENRSLRQRMGGAGKERVREKFDPQQNARRVEDLIIDG